jgi:ERCC4-type nuclease
MQKEGEITVSTIQLPVGDIVTGDVGIEHKTVGDFLGSTFDKKILRQAKELSDNFNTPVLIIHGDMPEQISWIRGDASRVHKTVIATKAAIARFGVSVIEVRSDQEYIEQVLAFIRQSDPNRPASDRPILTRKNNRNDNEIASDILCTLDGVGRKQAEVLFERFENVRGVSNATLAELMSVHGFGETKASAIFKAFNYRPKKEEEK